MERRKEMSHCIDIDFTFVVNWVYKIWFIFVLCVSHIGKKLNFFHSSPNFFLNDRWVLLKSNKQYLFHDLNSLEKQNEVFTFKTSLDMTIKKILTSYLMKTFLFTCRLKFLSFIEIQLLTPKKCKRQYGITIYKERKKVVH